VFRGAHLQGTLMQSVRVRLWDGGPQPKSMRCRRYHGPNGVFYISDDRTTPALILTLDAT